MKQVKRWLWALVLTAPGLVVAEAPDNVRVRGVRAYGRGCLIGSANGVVAPDGSSFSLLMDNYIARATGSRGLDRKNCDIQVDLEIPRGWSYSIISADYRGYVSADAGTIGTHQVIYSFDGRMPKNEEPGFENGNGYAFRATEFRGPTERDYTIQHLLEISRAPRSPCSIGSTQTLYFSTFLMARSVGSRSDAAVEITMDSLDGAVQQQQFRLVWYRCQGGVAPTPPPSQPNPPREPPRGPPGRPPRFGR